MVLDQFNPPMGHRVPVGSRHDFRPGKLSLILTITSLMTLLTNLGADALAQSGNQSDITGVNLVDTGLQTVVESEISPVDTTTESQPSDETQTEEEQATDESTSPSSEASPTIQPSDVDRPALEQQLLSPVTDPVTVFTLQSQAITVNYNPLLQSLGIQLQGNDPSAPEIARQLGLLASQTGNNAHYVQISGTETGQFVTTRIGPNTSPSQSRASGFPSALSPVPLNLASVLKSLAFPDLKLAQTPEQVGDGLVSRYITPVLQEGRTAELIQQFLLLQQFPQQLQNSGNRNQVIGRRLYDLLIQPLEADLEAAGADTLVISLDSGLLGLPIASLNDGQQYLIDKYAVVVVPSFGLADIGYTDIRNQSILAVGSETFSDQVPLPAVPVEVGNLLQTFPGRSLLNQSFTVDNFVQTFQEMTAQGDRPAIIHMATHGEFLRNDYQNSYIRFGDKPVSLLEFRNLVTQLGWDSADTAPELLVLSACRTAVGDPIAELGFGGLAVASGAKAALASLWYVSDLGTLALMQEFYNALKVNSLKSLALQQAQQHLRRGDTRLEAGKLILSNGQRIDLPPDLAQFPDQDFQDPYYWSAFTLIGNWN